MKLSDPQRFLLNKVAKLCGLGFIRLFGSTVRLPATARDVDVAVGPNGLTLAQLSLLQSTLEKIFKKQVDIISLVSVKNPVLIQEIGRHSMPLWEDKRGGRSAYIVMMDRLLAIAQDERLAFPKELRDQSLAIMRKRLRVS